MTNPSIRDVCGPTFVITFCKNYNRMNYQCIKKHHYCAFVDYEHCSFKSAMKDKEYKEGSHGIIEGSVDKNGSIKVEFRELFTKDIDYIPKPEEHEVKEIDYAIKVIDKKTQKTLGYFLLDPKKVDKCYKYPYSFKNIEELGKNEPKREDDIEDSEQDTSREGWQGHYVSR